jgi:hypothetical protein
MVKEKAPAKRKNPGSLTRDQLKIIKNKNSVSASSINRRRFMRLIYALQTGDDSPAA